MKKILLMMICLTIGFIPVTERDKAKDEIPVPAASILLECNTKTVLQEHNSDQKLNAGYLSKLMALLVIAEDIDKGEYSLDTELTASQTVFGMKGSVVWLEPGDKMSVEELLKSVIIGNANDALAVLAERSCGDIDTFVMEMNSRAFDLGARNTAFFSPYGFYDKREYTTAYDLALISAELWKYDFLQPYFKTWRDFVDGENVELVNENTLARTYKRHSGFKAAHSDQSGYCIAECGSSEDGTAFVAVVLGAVDEDASFGLAKSLINSGFNDYKVTDSSFPDEAIKPVIVKKGESSAVVVEMADQGDIVVPRGVTSLRIVTVIPDYLEAPVYQGERIGKATVYNGKNLVLETDIIVKNDVARLTFSFVFKKILSNIIN